MFKLLFSTAMIAPVLVFALGDNFSEDDLIAESATFTSAPAPSSLGVAAPADCRSETIAVVFHDTLLESHSAETLNTAFAPRAGCEANFVRVTTLLPEDAEDFDIAQADARRAEIAAHIEAVIGEEAARELPIRADQQSSAAANPLHHHALLRVERAPLQTREPAVALATTNTTTLN